tara:strand:+ start:3783 stop:4283 length:501 start_codon:yes stop_codon:yes gene_type:complete
MALTAISVSSADFIQKGGVEKVTMHNAGEISSALALADHKMSFGGDAAAKDLVFDPETAKLTVSSTRERGFSVITATVEGYVSGLTNAKIAALQANKDLPLVCLVHLNSDENFIIGWDDIYGEAADSLMPAYIDSIEIDSGAKRGDTNGATIKIVAIMGEMPREVG